MKSPPPWLKTLKVFSVDTRAGLHIYFARRDEGSQEKPLGSALVQIIKETAGCKLAHLCYNKHATRKRYPPHRVRFTRYPINKPINDLFLFRSAKQYQYPHSTGRGGQLPAHRAIVPRYFDQTVAPPRGSRRGAALLRPCSGGIVPADIVPVFFRRQAQSPPPTGIRSYSFCHLSHPWPMRLLHHRFRKGFSSSIVHRPLSTTWCSSGKVPAQYPKSAQHPRVKGDESSNLRPVSPQGSVFRDSIRVSNPYPGT